MDIYAFLVIGIFFGYLIGSIPFGLVIGKVFYKTDVRNFGSGNLGATNVARTLGPLAGIIVLIFDILKGGLPSFIMYKVAGHFLQSSNPEQLLFLSSVYCITGVCSALGHCHPLFANFKGGKAVATICGFLIFMNYKLFLIAIITFIIVVLISKIVSLGSIIAAVVVMITQFIPFIRESYLFSYNEFSMKLSLFVFHVSLILLALLLIYRHLANIQRLLRGEEKKFKIEKVNKKKDNA